MASGLSFFFSSPPHPTSNPWARPTTNYYTPQQPLRTTWTGAFAPPSPSPLRTSRNANLMSSPAHGGDLFPKHVEQDNRDENTSSAEHAAITPAQTSNSEPSATSAFSANHSGFTTPFSTSTTPSFSFDTAPATTSTLPSQPTTHEKPIFQFSARARSNSPSTLLQSHTSANRESRKRLFLDRLRNRRDETRSERMSDQVLRMDFMRERRMWEAEMEGQQNGVLDADMSVDDLSEAMGEDELAVAAIEEREVEELFGEYYAMRREDELGQGGKVDEEFSDDGYEEAFMEVLSQDMPQWSRDGGGNGVQSAAFGFAPGGTQEQEFGPADSTMDMS